MTPTFTSPHTTSGLLDMFNEGALPPEPTAFIQSCLDGHPDWIYLARIRKAVRPLGFHWDSSVDMLDYLAVAGQYHDSLELAILSLFDHGDGACLLGAKHCDKCGRWGWFSGEHCC